jgi:hypothetical protein
MTIVDRSSRSTTFDPPALVIAATASRWTSERRFVVPAPHGPVAQVKPTESRRAENDSPGQQVSRKLGHPRPTWIAMPSTRKC